MIRDPSDGSVRENSGGKSGCARKCVEAKDSGGSGIDRNSEDTTQGDRPAAMVKVLPPETSPVIDTTTSGLPDAAARDADRHARSRQWLADYRAGKFKPKRLGVTGYDSD